MPARFHGSVALLLALGASSSAAALAHDAAPAPPTASAAAPSPSGPRPRARFEHAFPALRFVNPVHVSGLRDGGKRLLVGEVGGRILAFDDSPDVRRADVVLDLTKRMLQRNFVEGLLGIALHPRWPERRDVFVFYGARVDRAGGAPQTLLSRFTWPRGAARIDPRSERVLLAIETKETYHHGGAIVFGPDGYLYVGVGDMGPQHDPGNVAQDLASLRGKILRLDVDAGATTVRPYGIPADNPFVEKAGARPEIWAYGFRNPYRLSFDPLSGGLWAGDVGQVNEEEIDLVVRGGNHGWNILEGRHLHRKIDGPLPPVVDPVVSYGREIGGSVTGGYVYRGRRVPDLAGAYVYADWVSSKAFFLRVDDAKKGRRAPQVLGTLRNPNTFGLDDDGELLAATMEGRIFPLVAGEPEPLGAEAPALAFDEPSLRALARSRSAVTRGRELFGRGCNACHGPLGQGAIGPNLRDDHWLRGSRLTDIAKQISEGNIQRGMPAWKEIYSHPDIAALAAYVATLSLGGRRSIAGAKKAEGKLDPLRLDEPATAASATP